MASVAEFIPVADTVLRIEGFRVFDVTKDVKDLSIPVRGSKAKTGEVSHLADKKRAVVEQHRSRRRRYDACIDAPTSHTLMFGRANIELGGVLQLADIYQTRTIGRILYYAKLRYMDEARPIPEILDLVDRDLSTEGLETLTRDLRGDLARPRRYEIAAALNRLSTLRITQAAE